MLGGAPAAIGANAGPFSWGATESGANPVRRRGEDAARFFGGLALSFIAPPYAKRLGREQPEDVLSINTLDELAKVDAIFRSRGAGRAS